MPIGRMAGGKGFEPLLAGPEPAVLPLNDPPPSSAHTVPDPLSNVKENLVSFFDDDPQNPSVSNMESYLCDGNAANKSRYTRAYEK